MIRKTIIFVLIGIFVLTICSCGNEKKNDVNNSLTKQIQIIHKEAATTSKYSGFNITTTPMTDETFFIPNPATIKDKPELFLHKLDKTSGLVKEPAYNLSFLGFDKDVYISNFVIGHITGSDDCLVLALDTNKEGNDNYAYIAVLDYKNKKSYLVGTDIFAGHGADEQLNLCDITGDGKDEIIFSSEPNTTIDWNIYQFDNENLKRIYSNIESAKLERDGFDADLLDNYKMKITGHDFNYKEIVSLLDLGYQKDDLEYKNPSKLSKEDNTAGRAYKNGKVIKGRKDNEWSVEIGFLMAENRNNEYAEYNYFKNIDVKQGICIPLRVFLGDDVIGKINVFLKYNADTKKMYINKAKFVS